MVDASLPPLPLKEWESTKHTLHLYLQLVGKVRLTLMPAMNHWWHVPLYVTARGLTTRTMPCGPFTLEIDFDFIDHRLIARSSRGGIQAFTLHDGLSVAAFYKKLFTALSALGADVSIVPKPFAHPTTTTRCPEDVENAAYDAEYVSRYWRILSTIEPIFWAFRGQFVGKSTPVHLFWHSLDLALTRFSGKAAPKQTDNAVEAKAYSHEVISFGFWAGDDNLPEPAFYSYTYPEPRGLAETQIQPEAAFWNTNGANATAILTYEAMRTSSDPRQSLMNFLESTYQAGASLNQWHIE